jgi:hypothetical protein
MIFPATVEADDRHANVTVCPEDLAPRAGGQRHARDSQRGGFEKGAAIKWFHGQGILDFYFPAA